MGNKTIVSFLSSKYVVFSELPEKNKNVKICFFVWLFKN